MKAADRKQLIEAARAAAMRAYAPYSRFRVGAALLGASGQVHTGFNVENVSYGLSMCAERTAMYGALLKGEKAFRALAIWTDSESPVSPCGACRQVLVEFCGNIPVVLCAGRTGRTRSYTLRQLMPAAFFDFPGAGRHRKKP